MYTNGIGSCDHISLPCIVQNPPDLRYLPRLLRISMTNCTKKTKYSVYLFTFSEKSTNPSEILNALDNQRGTSKDQLKCQLQLIQNFGTISFICSQEGSSYFVNFVEKSSSLCRLGNIVIGISFFMKRLEISKELLIGSLKAQGGSRVQRSLLAVGTKFPLV